MTEQGRIEATMTLDVNAAGGTPEFVARFAFTGERAVGANGLYLSAAQFAPHVGRAVNLLRMHDPNQAPLGIGRIELTEGGEVAQIRGELLDSTSGRDFAVELEAAKRYGKSMAASVGVWYDPSTLRSGAKLSPQARGAGGKFEYEIDSVSEVSVVDMGNFADAAFDLNRLDLSANAPMDEPGGAPSDAETEEDDDDEAVANEQSASVVARNLARVNAARAMMRRRQA